MNNPTDTTRRRWVKTASGEFSAYMDVTGQRGFFTVGVRLTEIQ